jgi:hypothetical protein
MNFEDRRRMILNVFSLLKQQEIKSTASEAVMLRLAKEIGMGVACFDECRSLEMSPQTQKIFDKRYKNVLDGLAKATGDEDMATIVAGFELIPYVGPGRPHRNSETESTVRQLRTQGMQYPQISAYLLKTTGITLGPDACRKICNPAKVAPKRPKLATEKKRRRQKSDRKQFIN